MNRNNFAPLRPMLILFILLSAFFIINKNWLTAKYIDTAVLITGNLLIFAVCIISFVITNRSFASKNPQASVRAIYGSFIIKLFVLAIAAFAYIMATDKHVNRRALVVCMGLYIAYTALEVSALFKLLGRKKNG